ELGATFRERDRRRFADPGGRAGDHHDLAAKLHDLLVTLVGVSSDVIEAHVRRLPAVDQRRWQARSVDPADLERALMAGGVAGVATHPLDNVRGNAQMLLDRDPDKEFGLTGLQDGMSLDRVLGLVERAAGAPIDRDGRYGPVEIKPGPILDAS